MTTESIEIDNQKAFTHMLHYNWKKGVIWLSKNNSKGSKVKITTKSVYISINEKDKFYYSRTGYAPLPEIGLKQPCSYLLKTDKNELTFNYWVKFMYERYMNLKHRQEAINKGDTNNA